MALDDVLLHTAVPLRELQQERVQGERILATVREEAFACVIFLPSTGVQSRRGRIIEKPQLMYLPLYPEPPVGSGGPVALRVGDRLAITAPEQNVALGLPGDTEIIWTLESNPQPLGKPGEEVLGIYATVRQVDD